MKKPPEDLPLFEPPQANHDPHPMNPDDDQTFDPEARREELLRRFAALPADQARGQIAILPYYHQLENEVTKPNQGTFVTRYFQTRWRPSLGPEASSIVLALRLLADRADGTTVASQELIAQTSGVSLRNLKRWLTENEKAVSSMSPAWRSQWRFLHQYFLKEKTARYLIRKEGPLSRAKRTTSLYKVAMDDPVHPDDEGKLFVKAAERIVQEEATKHANLLQTKDDAYKGQSGTHRRKQIIREGESPDSYEGQSGTHQARPEWPSLSLTDRINVLNVKEATTAGTLSESNFQKDPRVSSLTEAQKSRKEALTYEIGSWLHRKAGKDELLPHKSAGFHRRVAYFVPEDLIRKIMRDLDDELSRGREGSAPRIRDVSGRFGAYVKRVARQQRIDLIPRLSHPKEHP